MSHYCPIMEPRFIFHCHSGDVPKTVVIPLRSPLYIGIDTCKSSANDYGQGMTMTLIVFLLFHLLFVPCQQSLAVEPPDITAVPQDLTPPSVTEGRPAPGKRVIQVIPEWEGTEIHHLLYLPSDWRPDRTYPVIVEYAGNKWKTSLGTVEGSSLGYGISGGKGFIWVCMPFVDSDQKTNADTWWGDVDATVDYCITAVRDICGRYGGDSTAVFLAGFSRGAIACNFIGLHDDSIASLWCGFICHSHYDGVKEWPYEGSDRASAAKRLARLGGRPQFISHEVSVEDTKAYLAEACPGGNFTFMTLPYVNHTDTWVLRNIPERKMVREWVERVRGK